MKYRLVNKDIRENYITELLRERGVEDVNRFLCPKADDLQDWRDLSNMQRAVGYVDTSIKSKPDFKIGIVVDCDMDGFTSAAIVYGYLKSAYPDVEITHFIHSGKAHGLQDCWQFWQENPQDLLIIPDAGTNDKQYAEKLDMPILVLDHHLYEDGGIAENVMIVNNQMSPNYRNKNLSGAGIAYQFCRAFDYMTDRNLADDFVDLAAFGVVGDMMSGLEVENQFLWKKGLNSVKNKFLLALIEKQSYSMGGKVNPISVAFYIVPLVNAMIRVGTQAEKERMFLAFIAGDRMIPSQKRGAKGTMERVCVESARECTNARSKQNRILDAAEQEIEIKIHKYDLLENKILIVKLDEEDFPSELNGLVAMRLAARYKRPTIVARLNEEGYIRGSIRGVNNGPIESFKDFLMESGYCEYVMGHDNAAGTSMREKDLRDFHAWANNKLANVKLDEGCYDVNFVRAAADKDIGEIIQEVAMYADIWSTNCEEPRFYIHDINLTQSDIQVIGSSKDTVKFSKFGVVYIKFHAKDLIEELRQFEEVKVEVVGRGNLNEWMGNITPQIMIEGYEVSDGALGF